MQKTIEENDEEHSKVGDVRELGNSCWGATSPTINTKETFPAQLLGLNHLHYTGKDYSTLNEKMRCNLKYVPSFMICMTMLLQSVLSR